MSGERGGPQCGLTSLLPMSCRGRAAAFARDLHSRLRNLGSGNEDENESRWLAPDGAPRTPPAAPRDSDVFYDFELQCESPSSPIDDYDVPFVDRSPEDEVEAPFYDVDADVSERTAAAVIEQAKKTNGFRFSTAFYTDTSPVKVQPAPRENGHVDKRLFSPITFEGCARRDTLDEIDFVERTSPTEDSDRLQLPLSVLDSDSEFESAKSEPSEAIDENFESDKRLDNDCSECIENLSLIEGDLPVDEAVEAKEIIETIEDSKEQNHVESLEPFENGIEYDASLPAVEVDVAPQEEDEIIDDQDPEIEDDRPQRVRRCSSLKTGKTPPGTPGRKKIVRFADVLGLDLADVKTFMDEIPVIPKSAYDDLTGCDMTQNSPPVRSIPKLGSLMLTPLFQLPRDFTEKLERLNVCLESARVGDGIHVTVCGSVRVRNLDFHKTVHIRYTMDRWKTYTDLQTTYVQGSCDGFADRFQFVLYAPCISSGQRLEIAVRFQCKGQQFWDNNSGANYCFECFALGSMQTLLPSSPGPLHPTMDWHPSFY